MTNQFTPLTVGEIVRCIYESLAFKYRMVTDRLCECTNKSYKSIHVIGGGANNKLLCQMTANATNKEVIAGPVESTALGNVAVQLITIGELKSVNEARLVIKNSFAIHTYLPNNVKKWEAAYQNFCDLSK